MGLSELRDVILEFTNSKKMVKALGLSSKFDKSLIKAIDCSNILFIEFFGDIYLVKKEGAYLHITKFLRRQNMLIALLSILGMFLLSAGVLLVDSIYNGDTYSLFLSTPMIVTASLLITIGLVLVYTESKSYFKKRRLTYDDKVWRFILGDD